MLSTLRALPADEVARRSDLVISHLVHPGQWCGPGAVAALFGGLPGEPDLLPLLPWFHGRGVRVVFFAVEGRRLVPCEVRSADDLRRGALGVWEPVVEPARLVAPADLTVILTPALAFGRCDGSRLGRGAGFYDRFFADPRITARRIGIGFDLQVLSAVPVEPHDARVHALVTESGWTLY
ncbi:MAG: 5-formyltetrahydrofolate cyclo-ligase [Verrucomicrobiaceae bacterium]|nr:5-formyltetrahydrofolate cyclo-ligase [Verrucomicrobiaceae bacterium]